MRPAFAAGDGRHVDDPAAALLHHRPHRRLRDEEGAAQVEVEDRVPLLGAHPEQEVVACDAGVVHEDVEPPTAERQRGLHDLVGLTVRGDIALDESGFPAGILDELLGLLGGRGVALEVDGDVRAFARESKSRSAADPAATASDQRSTPVELGTHAPKLAGTRLEGRLRR